ncbi:MAG TPA: MotA/TolQ/ExbB proton channel family protein [Clostridia bacterium]|nr:MotA/TolQ/ExbB proton channel family protein [Clostridia bacterium]
MNFSLILGVLVALGGVLAGFLIEKGTFISLWSPSAFCIVFGGTIGIAMITYPMSSMKKIPAAMKLITFQKKHDTKKLVDMLCDIANKARKEGILSLESEADKVKDPFIKKGLGYIADGVDPEFLRKMLENEIEVVEKKYKAAAAVFEGMGGTGPTMGVLGTVMGMTTILKSMNADMDSLGKNIAVAFLATLYGVGSANILWLPIGGNIKVVAERESDYQMVILEGLMAIQSGESSSRLRDRLETMLSEKKGKSAGKEEHEEEK